MAFCFPVDDAERGEGRRGWKGATKKLIYEMVIGPFYKCYLLDR